MKELISTLKDQDAEIEQNIFKSVENINLKTVVAYKDIDDKKHRYIDDYAD